MTDARRILLVGFGNMGRALAEGWLERGTRADVAVLDPSIEARARARELGFETPERAVPGAADVIVLAVKPHQLEEAVPSVREALAAEGVMLSIAAGRTLAQIAALAGDGVAIVRAMPNTPAAIGRGMIVLCASAAVSQAHQGVCEELMSAVGSVEWVEDETLMDAVTAVSGSGPAYVFLLIECLAAAGRRAGLPAELAARLATVTVAGAGEYAARADEDAAELRRRVTSPNGTTEAALERLMSGDALAGLIDEAVAAATRRSRELSGQ